MSESKAYERAMEEWLDMTVQERIEAIAEHSDTHREWEEFKFFVDWCSSVGPPDGGWPGGLNAAIAYVEDRANQYLAARAQLIREGSV